MSSILDYDSLKGSQKCAILLMALDEQHATKMFSLMDDDEIRGVSQKMATLGHVKSDIVERLSLSFIDEMNNDGLVFGTHESTERLLLKALGKDRGSALMEELRGPAGRNTWDKLGNVSEEMLATYLKNEYPQTAALILSKIRPDHSAAVLESLPEDFAMEIIMRMLQMDSVKKEIVDSIEKTLKVEFMSNLGKTQSGDSHEMIAEIFNNFERQIEAKFMSELEERDAETAERIRALMFTFEDMEKVDPVGIQTLLRAVDKEKLATALKGSSEDIKELFLGNMSERAAKIMREDIESMGPVRLKDVDEAQQYVIGIAKDLASKGDIFIADGSGEQLVY